MYAHTSVFGGTSDEQFSGPSQRLFQCFGEGRFTLVLSAEVVRELLEAPAPVQDVLAALAPDVVETVPVDEEVVSLAEAYVAAGVVGPGSWSDAVHVAAAAAGRADVLVSWNFRHIVSLDRIRRYNAVNVLRGYSQIEIRSPAEIVYGEEQEDV